MGSPFTRYYSQEEVSISRNRFEISLYLDVPSLSLSFCPEALGPQRRLVMLTESSDYLSLKRLDTRRLTQQALSTGSHDDETATLGKQKHTSALPSLTSPIISRSASVVRKKPGLD